MGWLRSSKVPSSENVSQVANESPRQRRVILLPRAKGTHLAQGTRLGPQGHPWGGPSPPLHEAQLPPFKPPVHSSLSAGLKDNCLWQFIFQPSHEAKANPALAPARAHGTVLTLLPAAWVGQGAVRTQHRGSLKAALRKPQQEPCSSPNTTATLGGGHLSQHRKPKQNHVSKPFPRPGPQRKPCSCEAVCAPTSLGHRVTCNPTWTALTPVRLG